MKHPFLPDRVFTSKDDITPSVLANYGITHLICDIDNTLVPYTSPDPNESVLSWVASMREAGIKLALVSNNDEGRVERFNKPLGLPAFANCKKPYKTGILRALENIGGDAEHTAMLGDQLFTDVLAARRCGLSAFLVPPIEPVETAFFKFKRALEKPFLRRYQKIHKTEEK